MKIQIIGTLNALETLNQIYQPQTRILDILKDMKKGEELLEHVYSKIEEGC